MSIYTIAVRALVDLRVAVIELHSAAQDLLENVLGNSLTLSRRLLVRDFKSLLCSLGLPVVHRR